MGRVDDGRLDPGWSFPLVGADGPVAVVSGRVAYRMARLLVAELRRARDNGERLDPELIATIRAIEAAGRAYATRRIDAALAADGDDPVEATSSVPPADDGERPAPEPDPESVGHVAGVAMSTAAVAARLGCSERNVRALADRGALAGRRVGRTWVFDPVDVEEYAAARASA